jgi:hypothetical protein
VVRLVGIAPVRGGVTGGVVGNVASPSAESHIVPSRQPVVSSRCPKATPNIGNLDGSYQKTKRNGPREWLKR